jgi:hypothetical protein
LKTLKPTTTLVTVAVSSKIKGLAPDLVGVADVDGREGDVLQRLNRRLDGRRRRRLHVLTFSSEKT